MALLRLIFLNAGAWIVIQLGLAWLLSQLPAQKFHRPTRAGESETDGRVYERWFAVKHWKHALPDAGGWFAGGYAKKRLRGRSREALVRFSLETRRAELVHWLAICALPIFALWNRWPGLLLNAAYAVAANLPCIIAQRYNRARLARVISK